MSERDSERKPCELTTFTKVLGQLRWVFQADFVAVAAADVATVCCCCYRLLLLLLIVAAAVTAVAVVVAHPAASWLS